MKKRTLKELIFGKKLDYSGLPVMKRTLRTEEFKYEIEKAKQFSIKETFSKFRKKIPKKEIPSYKSSYSKGLPEWAKVFIVVLLACIFAAFIAWLVSLRPNVILQIRGADAQTYIAEQQGIVTNLSANIIILFIILLHIEFVVANRIFLPQGLLARGK